MSFKDFPFINNPTPIAVIIIFDKYIPGWFGWEPETLREEIPGDKIITEDIWSMIFACAATVNQARGEEKVFIPWTEPDVFGDISIAFQGVLHNPEFWQKPTLSQIWYTLKVLDFIDSKQEIEEDVAAYISCCLIDNDIYTIPFEHKMIHSKMRELTPDHIDELANKIDYIWNNIALRDKAIKRPVNNPINIQILKMEAARQVVDGRIAKGIQQIEFIG